MSIDALPSTTSTSTILLIDDHDDVRDLWALLLEFHGFNVLTARDGMEGVDRARAHRPALIVTDLTMPKLDGLGVCRALRADTHLATTPIILWTAAHPPEAKGLADIVLQKPVLIDVMLGHIQRVLGSSQHKPQAE